MASPIVTDIKYNTSTENTKSENYTYIGSIIFAERLFYKSTNPIFVELSILRDGSPATFTIQLGDADLNVVRNTHYQILGTVTANKILFEATLTTDWQTEDHPLDFPNS